MGVGGTLPSTGMWQGEVFAISDCLVVIVFCYLWGWRGIVLHVFRECLVEGVPTF